MASAVKCLSVSSCWWPAGTIFLKSVLRNGMRGKQLLGESLKVTSPIFRGSSRGYFSVYLSDIIHDIIERILFRQARQFVWMRGDISAVFKVQKFWKFSPELHFHQKEFTTVADSRHALMGLFFWRVPGPPLLSHKICRRPRRKAAAKPKKHGMNHVLSKPPPQLQ